jgi:endoglucanase Acf2
MGSVDLYGQATGNEELTDLGVYLYTTEVNSVNNYWFDIDGDILDSNYTASTTSANKHNVASIVWGGKYDTQHGGQQNHYRFRGLIYYLLHLHHIIWERVQIS